MCFGQKQQAQLAPPSDPTAPLINLASGGNSKNNGGKSASDVMTSLMFPMSSGIGRSIMFPFLSKLFQ